MQNANGTQSLLPVQLSANADTAKSIIGAGSAQIVQQTSDSLANGSHCVAVRMKFSSLLCPFYF